jgi:hypothetical protein
MEPDLIFDHDMDLGDEPEHTTQLRVLSYNMHNCFPAVVAPFEDHEAINDYDVIAIQEPYLNTYHELLTTYKAGNAVNFWLLMNPIKRDKAWVALYVNQRIPPANWKVLFRTSYHRHPSQTI